MGLGYLEKDYEFTFLPQTLNPVSGQDLMKLLFGVLMFRLFLANNRPRSSNMAAVVPCS